LGSICSYDGAPPGVSIILAIGLIYDLVVQKKINKLNLISLLRISNGKINPQGLNINKNLGFREVTDKENDLHIFRKDETKLMVFDPTYFKEQFGRLCKKVSKRFEHHTILIEGEKITIMKAIQYIFDNLG
jgi:hypothetical protein